MSSWPPARRWSGTATAPPARETALRRLVEHYRHTWLLPESAALDASILKRAWLCRWPTPPASR